MQKIIIISQSYCSFILHVVFCITSYSCSKCNPLKIPYHWHLAISPFFSSRSVNFLSIICINVLGEIWHLHRFLYSIANWIIIDRQTLDHSSVYDNWKLTVEYDKYKLLENPLRIIIVHVLPSYPKIRGSLTYEYDKFLPKLDQCWLVASRSVLSVTMRG